MVKIPIDVRNGAARFDVTVRAESIRRDVSLVRERYPGGDVGVRFPIDPRDFFMKDCTARAVTVGFDRPDGIAA